MNIRVRLFPPLNDAARQDRVELSLEDQATLQGVIDALIDRFGPPLRRHLFDHTGRFIPAWCAFIGERPIPLNRPENLFTSLRDGDEVSFLLNIAGG